MCSCWCCQHSKIMMWCWPWCVPIQEQLQAKTHHVLHNSWHLPVLIDGVCLTYSSWTRQKSWACPYCVSSMRNRRVSKTGGFNVILVECTVCNKNLKPNQTPPRCWDLMPQVDSGPCKLHGRDNENWWKTALSSCIRGLTGQSVPKSKWQEMLFLTAQWQGGQAVAPHQQMPSILTTWLT